MKKSLLISEVDNIAALLENDRVVEFFVNRGELLLGDVYTATVENILPGIDAAFVNLGKDKMGFLHANDVPGEGALKEKLVPKQKLLVQITKEPTGHKGPRVSTAISLPGRFLVLVPEERGVSISRRISEAKERARLKAVVNLMKPPGVGLIIRTEAKGQGEQELFEDFETLWDRWQTIVSDGEASIGPSLIYRDQDLLFRVIRDAYSNDVSEIVTDSPEGQKRALDYMQGWASRNTKVIQHSGEESLLLARGIDKEIEAALSDRVELPSGGHLNIQPTEALTVIDVNSGRFTSSRTQGETVRRTNVEAAQEIPRQLRLRNIGGMVIVDFIDMDNRRDQQQVLEQFQRSLEDDRAKPQIGQLSDLGLVELTRRRQGQSLRELFTTHCPTCTGLGVIPTLELGYGEHRKVLTFKGRDEDSRGRRGQRGGNRQQPSALRAVTASSGRIKPIMVEAEEGEEEDLMHVSEEILSQVPEELLTHQHAFGKQGSLDLHDHESEIEDRSAHFGEQNREDAFNRGPLYSAKHTDFHADDEDDEPVSSVTVEQTIEIFEEMHETPQYRREERPPAVSYAQPSIIDADSADDVDDEDDDIEVDAELVATPAPESPFETEIDPVTGIYRLKVKPNQEASFESAGDNTASSSTATATWDMQHSHEHDHEHGGHQHGEEHTHEHQHEGRHSQAEEHDLAAADYQPHTEPIQTADSIDLSGVPQENAIVWQTPDEQHNTGAHSEPWKDQQLQINDLQNADSSEDGNGPAEVHHHDHE